MFEGFTPAGPCLLQRERPPPRPGSSWHPFPRGAPSESQALAQFNLGHAPSADRVNPGSRPFSEAPLFFLGRTHLVVEGAISPALRGGHSALLPDTHCHIGVNVDSYQLLGLQHCDPHLKGAEEEKEAICQSSVWRVGGIHQG